MARDKLRIRFRKLGDLRLVSHHDLMRCLERMLRRAALPFRSTEGFNPKPKMAFALSLALGIEGCDEIVELELLEVLATDEIHARLKQHAPAGFEILSVERIDPRVRAQVRRACYQIEVPSERTAEISERATRLLTETHCWVERTRPRPRRLDVRPYLRDLRVIPGTPPEAHDAPMIHLLEMDLVVTPTGTARPDDVLGLLGLGDLLSAGAVLRRTLLELHDHSPSTSSVSPAEAAPGEGGGLPAESGMETETSVGAMPHAAE